jgi:ISXO2-like transposase domain
MRERGGRTVAMPIERADKDTIQAAIHRHVAAGSTLHTDEGGAYTISTMRLAHWFRSRGRLGALVFGAN